MSPSQPPLSRAGAGWSIPENDSHAMTPSGRSSPGGNSGQAESGSRGVTWASAKARTEELNGYSSFLPRTDGGFFGRHYRRLSDSLPRFHIAGRGRDYAEKEKLGRGRWFAARGSFGANLITYAGRILRRMRLRFLLVIVFLLALLLFYITREFLF